MQNPLPSQDSDDSAELLPLVYDELRRLAGSRMAREKCEQTLQPTALVHEAWLRLARPGAPRWNDRAHFFRAAALAMRRILVDRARGKASVRRGSGAERGRVKRTLDIHHDGAVVHGSARRKLLHDPDLLLSCSQPRLAEPAIGDVFGVWWALGRATDGGYGLDRRDELVEGGVLEKGTDRKHGP